MGKKKEEILGNKDSLNDLDNNVKQYDLSQEEKNELQALLALMEQARLAQDIIYTRLVNSVAARHKVKNAKIEINLGEVFKDGVDKAVLYATLGEESSPSAE